MITVPLVEGWTGPIDQVLKVNGAAEDLTGMTVLLQLWDQTATAVALSGATTVVTPAAGVVRFSPGANDLVASKSPYSARWKVTDGGGKVVFFPHDEPDVWIVRKP